MELSAPRRLQRKPFLSPPSIWLEERRRFYVSMSRQVTQNRPRRTRKLSISENFHRQRQWELLAFLGPQLLCARTRAPSTDKLIPTLHC